MCTRAAANPRHTSGRIPQLKIEQKPLDTCEMELTVEVDAERLDKAKRAAARRLAQKYSIPGFRKGKAPYEIVLHTVGEGTVMEEAADDLWEDAYKAALEETKLEPYAPGRLAEVKLNPMVFVFKVPTQPEVDLGAYRSVRLGYTEPSVTDEALDETLEHMREHQAVLEPVERAAQIGDVIRLDIAGVLKPPPDVPAEPSPENEAASPLSPPSPMADETPISFSSSATGGMQRGGDEPAGDEFLMDDKDVEVLLQPDLNWPLPGFAEKVVAMAVGDVRHFELNFPGDYGNESLRGRLAHFDVKCNSVKSRTVPEWDDELAKSLGDYDSLADLRAKVRDELLELAKRRMDEEYGKSAVDTVVAGTTVKFPPALLSREVDDLVDDLDRRLREQKLTVKEYLKIQKITEEQMRQDLEPHARERLRRSLALGKVIEVEGLTVTEEEVAAHIETVAAPFGAQAAQFKTLLNSEPGRRSIRVDLLSQRAVDRVKAIAKGENPPLPEPTPYPNG